MFLGAAVLPVLRQLCYTYGIKSELEYAVIGGAFCWARSSMSFSNAGRRGRGDPGAVAERRAGPRFTGSPLTPARQPDYNLSRPAQPLPPPSRMTAIYRRRP